MNKVYRVLWIRGTRRGEWCAPCDTLEAAYEAGRKVILSGYDLLIQERLASPLDAGHPPAEVPTC